MLNLAIKPQHQALITIRTMRDLNAQIASLMYIKSLKADNLDGFFHRLHALTTYDHIAHLEPVYSGLR